MLENIVLGGGCFWCIKAIFKELEGVEKVTSGYAGGDTKNPSYEEVKTGETNHAEVVKIEYDPKKISFENILKIFFKFHDPTQKNHQGPDVGSQYRSIILYKNEKQKEIAKKVIEGLKDGYKDTIVTELQPLKKFYPAEEHHQDYFEKNPKDTYCQIHVKPKVEKIKQEFN